MLNLLHSLHGAVQIEFWVAAGLLLAMGGLACSGRIQSQQIHAAGGPLLMNGVQRMCGKAEKSDSPDPENRRLRANVFTGFRSSGFTLIELMIGIVIVAILAAAALPSFRTMLQNSQIRNAAESISSGLQRARAEAVARNTNVAFVLGTQSSWTVSVVAPASGIESRSANEGSKDVTLTILPPGATTATFSNFGVLVSNADASASLTQIDLTAAGGSQNLRVTLGSGGNIKMCDPGLASGSSPRAC